MAFWNRGGGVSGETPGVGDGVRGVDGVARDKGFGKVIGTIDDAGDLYLDIKWNNGTKSQHRPWEVAPTNLN